MVNYRLGQTDQSMATGTQAPAEIDLLLVGKEGRVETTRLTIESGSDNQAGT